MRVVPSSSLSEEEMAALVIAVEMLATPRRVIDGAPDVTPRWRFSGRWFAADRRFF